MKANGQQPGSWHAHPIRVRYQETDQMGVVYHANYVNWFEIGRTELIRKRGFSYKRIEELGLFLPVVELESKFRQPAKYDDTIVIYTRIAAYNAKTVHFESQIRKAADEAGPVAGFEETEPQGTLLVAGTTRHVWLDRDWKPVRIDKLAPELFRLLGDER